MLGNWPRRYGDFHLLYDVTVDGRERADIAGQHPKCSTNCGEAWERIDAELLPIPSHPRGPAAAPHRGAPAVSEPD